MILAGVPLGAQSLQFDSDRLAEASVSEWAHEHSAKLGAPVGQSPLLQIAEMRRFGNARHIQ